MYSGASEHAFVFMACWIVFVAIRLPVHRVCQMDEDIGKLACGNV